LLLASNFTQNASFPKMGSKVAHVPSKVQKVPATGQENFCDVIGFSLLFWTPALWIMTRT
jgi:hypothetical protein